jgi:putative ABC transport system substrate-binding protein
MAAFFGRRELIAAFGATAFTWPLMALAQGSPKRPLIAWLSSTTQAYSTSKAAVFLQAMQELGYVEGKHFDIVYRSTGGYQDRLPALAKELVELKPDVIFAIAIGPAVAARNVTSTIPIVSPALADAVHLGLIASDARPGGNVTGIQPYVAGLPAKQLEIAREIVPSARTVGLLTNVIDPKAPPQVTELEAAGRAQEIKIVAADANRPDDIDGALQVLANQSVDVVIVLQTSMLISQTRKIAEAAIAKRLPTVYGYREHVLDADWSVMASICAGAISVPHLLWTKFCAVPHPATCLSSSQPRCCCRSTSRPPRRSASLFRQRSSPAPTR